MLHSVMCINNHVYSNTQIFPFGTADVFVMFLVYGKHDIIVL